MVGSDDWFRRAFVGASAAWALLLPLTAFVASRPQAPSFVYAGAAAVYVVGSVLCHQLPERSYHLWGVQLPVCARCLGIYVAGAVVAAAAATVGSDGQRNGRRTVATIAGPTARRVLFAAALPTLATLVYEWVSGKPPDNGVRAIAGAALGASVAWLVVQGTRAPGRSPEPADG